MSVISVYIFGAGWLYNRMRPILQVSMIDVIGIILTDSDYSSIDGYKTTNLFEADYEKAD